MDGQPTVSFPFFLTATPRFGAYLQPFDLRRAVFESISSREKELEFVYDCCMALNSQLVISNFDMKAR